MTRKLSLSALVLSMLALTLTASATPILDEQFITAGLDSTTWNTAISHDVLVIGNHHAYMPNPGSSSYLQSNASFLYKDLYMDLSPQGNGNYYFGLYGGGSSFILLRSDISPVGGKLGFQVYKNGVQTIYEGAIPRDANARNQITIVWHPDLLQVWEGGTRYYETTDSNLIPDVAIPIGIGAYSGGSHAVYQITVTPEPVTMVLLAVGGLLGLRRKF